MLARRSRREVRLHKPTIPHNFAGPKVICGPDRAYMSDVNRKPACSRHTTNEHFFLCFVWVRVGNRTHTILYAFGTSGDWPVSKQSVPGSCPTKQFCTSWPLRGQKGAEEKKHIQSTGAAPAPTRKTTFRNVHKKQCPGSNRSRSTRRNVGSQDLKYNSFSNMKSEVSPSRRHHYICVRWMTYRFPFLDANTMPCSECNIIFSPDAGFSDGFDKWKIESKHVLSVPFFFIPLFYIPTHFLYKIMGVKHGIIDRFFMLLSCP